MKALVALPRRARTTLPLLVAIVAGCGVPGDGALGDPAAVPAAERYGGTAVIGLTADLQTMNPLVASDSRSVDVHQNLLFMPLLRYDERMEPAPRLAESWDTVRVAPDTIEITFHLRSDVHWHDGTPTTAEDVLFTFERAIDPRTGYPNQSSFDLWSREVEVVDPHTIRFRLRPHAEYLASWERLGIVPAHILGEVPPEELIRHAFGTAEPVGNGPFRFARRNPGQEWVFEANPDHPEALGGRPYLDRVVMRVIPDPIALMTEIITGRLHFYEIQPAQVGRLEQAAGVEVLSSPYRSWTYIGWNTRNPLFADPRVRRALSLGIDRQALVDAVLYGHGDVGVSSSTPGHWVYDDRYRELVPRRDLDEARRLLAEAGWAPGRDGILRNPQGQPFQFTLVTNQGNETRQEVGQIVQAQLQALGIRADPRTLEWNTLVQMLDGVPLPEGGRRRDFQAVTSGWVDSFRKDDAPQFHSRHADGPYAETGFHSPRTDALLDSLAVIVDRRHARPLWQEYHQILIDESPYAVLYYQRRLGARRTALNGVTVDVRGDLAEIERWWLHPDGR